MTGDDDRRAERDHLFERRGPLSDIRLRIADQRHGPDYKVASNQYALFWQVNYEVGGGVAAPQFANLDDSAPAVQGQSVFKRDGRKNCLSLCPLVEDQVYEPEIASVACAFLF